MAHIPPLVRSEHPELAEVFELYDRTLSFCPNSLITLARRPEMLRALSALITACYRSGTVQMALKPLLALVASTAAGCRYCQAHEAVDAHERGVPDEKIAAVWEFETSPLYSDAERVALRFARDASLVPNGVTDAHYADLRAHWDDGQIVELLAVISLFGFLNRWNDSIATALEEIPTTFAAATLGPRWEAGKHG